jgi:tetratricopeptide (TPR) repeat protein
MGNLAMDHYEAGRYDDAVPLLEDAIARQEENLGDDHPETLGTKSNLALVYRDSGRADEAVRLLREALPVAERKLGAENAQTLGIRRDLARAHLDAGDPGEAIPTFRDLVARGKAGASPEDPRTLSNLNNLVRAYLDAHRWAEAEAAARECLEIRTRTRPDDGLRFHTMGQLGAALAGQGRRAEAEPLLLDGYEGLAARAARTPGLTAKDLKKAAARIATFYDDWGQPTKGAEWRSKQSQVDADGPGANEGTPR